MRWLTLALLVALVACAPEMFDERCTGTACTHYGKCSWLDGACTLLHDEQCRKSFDCEWFGLCYRSDDGTKCIAKDDADCKASRDCKDKFYGRCSLVNDVCRKLPSSP